MANQKTFAELVSGQIAAVQARAAGLIDFTIGSVLRAVVEACGMIALWLEALVLSTLARSRAATSQGADLDSWMADFGLTRLLADWAVGGVTFQRFSATAVATIPVGSSVETGDGTQSFLVTLDLDHPALNVPQDGYLMGIGVTSLIVPVRAVVAGAAGNVAPGAISVITSTIPGVDKVVNEEVLQAGTDAETDAAFRTRFPIYLAGLGAGTKDAVLRAIRELGPGVDAAVVENELYDGTPALSFFYVVVDDGTGDPSEEFMAQARAAVEANRPLGTTWTVYPPVVIVANVATTIEIVAGYDGAEVEALVEDAISDHINTLGLGEALDRNRLIQIAYDASEGVFKVVTLLVNGGTADIAATFKDVVKSGSVAASTVT